jgi:hypothetical protein
MRLLKLFRAPWKRGRDINADGGSSRRASHSTNFRSNRFGVDELRTRRSARTEEPIEVPPSRQFHPGGSP